MTPEQKQKVAEDYANEKSQGESLTAQTVRAILIDGFNAGHASRDTEVKGLRDALESVSSYFDTEDEGTHVCDYSTKLEARMKTARQALTPSTKGEL